MKTEIKMPEGYITSRWSGGTTTQLYIYPEDGDYAKRRFMVRISSAEVELDESDFTALPGVTRYITPLSGGFTLSHPGMPEIKMEPLDAPYRFDGGIETHCAGRARDFNLMLKGADGTMEVMEGRCRLSGLTCIYPVGGGEIKINGAGCDVPPGGMAVIHDGEGEASFSKAIVCHVKI